MSETYVNYGTQLNNTSETTILTPPSGGVSLVNGVHIANILSSGTLAVSVDLYKNSTPFTLIKNAAIPVQSSFQLLDTPVPVESGDLLKATASASGIHIVVSALEII